MIFSFSSGGFATPRHEPMSAILCAFVQYQHIQHCGKLYFLRLRRHSDRIDYTECFYPPGYRVKDKRWRSIRGQEPL
jgi:hypothetical protein